MHFRLYIGLPRKVIACVLIFTLFLVSFIPSLSFALFGTISLPATPATSLGAPPFTHNGELFDGPPSHYGLVIDENRHFNLYSTQLSAGTAYRFVAESIGTGGFDDYIETDMLLFLADSTGNVVASSVESGAIGEGLEVRFIPPSAGTFLLITTSTEGNTEGHYRLISEIIPNFAEITGVVRNVTADPLAEILVTAYLQTDTAAGSEFVPHYSTLTQANGTFTLSPLFTGTYIVSFSDPNLSYGSLYYHQTQEQDLATLINLYPGARRTLEASYLTPAATITGTVTSTASTPLNNIIVTAYLPYDDTLLAMAGTETDPSGTFALTGLAAGSYYVAFYCPSGLFISQFYDQVPTTTTATRVSVSTGATVSNINARMRQAAQISGTVRDDTNAALEGIVVTLLRRINYVTAPFSEECFEVITQTITRPNIYDEDDPTLVIDSSELGTYFFGGLELGTYFLHFSDPLGRFLDVYYTNGFVPARAGPLNVTTAQHFTGHDIALTRPASVAGTVTNIYADPLEGIRIALFDTYAAPTPLSPAFFEYPTFETHSEADGTFILTDIYPSTFIVQYFDPDLTYSTLYHYQQTDPNLANRITKVPGTHSTLLPAQLRSSSQILGILIDYQTGLPLEGAQVFLFADSTDPAALTPAHTTQATANGSFSFTGLEPGTFYLGFVAPGYTAPEDLQFAGEVFCITQTTPIALGTGQHLELDQIYWIAFPTFSITLHGHNSQGPQILTIRQGQTLNYLPEPELWGHRFEGWHTQAIGGTRIQTPLTPTTNLTFHAQWRVADFVFTFDSHGGSAIPDHFFYFGDRIGTFPAPVRPGFEFTGWFDRPIAGFRVMTGELVTGSRTLHAQWRPARHTVTFNAHGGSHVAQRIVIHAQTVGNLPTPQRARHTFLGWFSAPTGGVRITPGHTITQNTTLHARWAVQRVTLRLDTRGGRAIPAQSREVGTRIGNLPRPTRPNRVFDRWTLDAAGRRPVNANATITGNMTVFAQWRSNDAHLRNIARSAGTLNRRFAPRTFNYRLNLRARTTWVRITPQPRDSEATIAMRTSNRQNWRNMRTIRISVPRGQTRVIQIRVTSEDRRESRIYRVTVRRALR